jgi:hypothetical protein
MTVPGPSIVRVGDNPDNHPFPSIRRSLVR